VYVFFSFFFSFNFTVQVPLKEVKEEWLKTAGPLHIRRVAEHYGVYDDLFGDAFFTPRVKLDIHYELTDESYLPVHRGNVIKPSEVVFGSIMSLN
jgi:large subunit ribosomal protein L38